MRELLTIPHLYRVLTVISAIAAVAGKALLLM